MSSPLRSPEEYYFASFYEFVFLEDVTALSNSLYSAQKNLLGLIILAEEGINGTIAGSKQHVESFVSYLQQEHPFKNLEIKYSTALMERMPFRKFKIKIKSEIVTSGLHDLDTLKFRGNYVEPKDWNELIADPEVLVIDTRNVYEYRIGTFKGARNPQTQNFRDFPQAIAQLINEEKPKQVAMFCTGGIRCEKASAYLKQLGIDHVHHLHGGILKYFEDVSADNSLWEGKCFVFDGRITVDQDLIARPEPLCKICGQVMLKDNTSNSYLCFQCREYPINK